MATYIYTGPKDPDDSYVVAVQVDTTPTYAFLNGVPVTIQSSMLRELTQRFNFTLVDPAPNPDEVEHDPIYGVHPVPVIDVRGGIVGTHAIGVDGLPIKHTAEVYVASYFGGDDVNGQKLFLATSVDLRKWTPVGPPVASATSPAILRDPNIVEYGGQLVLLHSHTGFVPPNSTVGLQVSQDGGASWTALPDINLSAAATLLGGSALQYCYADNIYVDESGLPHVFIVVATVESPAAAKRVEIHPNDTALSSWSAPVNCSTGLPSGTNGSLDYSVMKVGAVFHGFFKDNTAEKIVHATAATFLGPWTITNSDVTGMVQVEASHVIKKPAGGYRLYFDHYIDGAANTGDQVSNPDADGWRFRFARSYYMDSTDLTTWGAPQEAVGLGRFPRVRKFPSVDVSTLRDVTTPHARLERRNTLTLTTGSTPTIALDFAVEDTTGMWNSNRQQVAVCRVPGLYRIGAFALWLPVAGAAGNRLLQVTVNGGFVSELTSKQPCSANTDLHQSINSVVRLRRGDELRVLMQQDSGSSIGVDTATVPVTLTATRVGG